MNTPKRKPTLVFLQELLKGINANKGTVNCGHCALRFNDHMASGENLALGAVPKENAGLDFEPFIKSGKIESTLTQDQRIIDRTTAPPEDSRVIIHIDHHSGTTLEIDLTTGSQPHDRVHFYPEREDTIVQALQALPRRKKDGTAYGFILLTHDKRNGLGHIFNYFVDSDKRGNQVYFIDAQKPRAQITTKLDLSGYRSEIFYRPSIPPEGIKIKSEPKVRIKQESDILMKNEFGVDTFINKVVEAAKAAVKTKDDRPLKSLLPNRDSVNVYGNDKLSAVMHLLKAGQKEAANFLVNYGAKLEDFICYAAYTNNKDLANLYVKIMAEKRLKPNDNRVAAYAANGGHTKLVKHCLGKIANESRRDYNQVANYADQGGHHKLAEQIRNKSIMHSNVSQDQNSENTLPRAETLLFRQSNHSATSKIPLAPSLPERIVDNDFIKQELSISRAKLKLLESELAIKNQLIALQVKEIAALRKRLNENEQESDRVRKVF